MLKNLIPAYSVLFVNFQALLQKIGDCWAQILRNFEGFCLDIFYELVLAAGSPGCFSVQDFIEDETYGPNVAFWGIRLPLQDLYGHIKRGSNCSLVFHAGLILFGKTEIADFANILGQENIGRF